MSLLPASAAGYVYLADNTTSTTTGALTGRPVLQVNEQDAYQVCDDINKPTFSTPAAQVSVRAMSCPVAGRPACALLCNHPDISSCCSVQGTYSKFVQCAL